MSYDQSVYFGKDRISRMGLFQSKGSDQLSALVQRELAILAPDLGHARVGQAQRSRNVDVADAALFKASEQFIGIKHATRLPQSVG